MKSVGILYHPKISAAVALAHDLERVLRSQDISVWLCSTWEEERAKEQVTGTDLILSVGGDGTILRAARIVVPGPIPILGINLGRLGFMTEVSSREALDRVPAFVVGEGWIDERSMLQIELFPSGAELSPIPSFYALNDIVVGRGGVSRVVYVKATIDGELLTTYKADGVIVATATGSTGYSLSVGGPILHPQAKEIVLNPISPHLSLTAALVLPPPVTIELEVRTDHQAMLSIDGQVELMLNNSDLVKVKRSPYTTQLLRSQPMTFFYRTLAQRLSSKQS